MRIGIMGGTFDPIHNGHLMLGKYARDLFELDEIWFMPNGNPPHKNKETFETETKHRVEMVQRAIVDEHGFALQLYEVENKDKNYSYLTMEHFIQRYPKHKFYFIVGADSLFALEKWACPERLLRTCVMLAAYRDGKNTTEMNAQIAYLNEKYGGDIRLLRTPEVNISSNEIRRRVKDGLSIKNMVPESVCQYISENQLYTDELTYMKKKVGQMLNDDRYQHTIGVMNTAMELAQQYNESSIKAQIAGLLHDYAKGFSNCEKLELCEKYGIDISDEERKNPGLLHAKLGAYLAKSEYGIQDCEILDAIRWHTTGRPEMTKLDKIIYVADYIEPNRDKAPNLDEIRRLAQQDLEQCLYEILKASLEYLTSRKEVIDPMTEKTYLYYRHMIEKEEE